jgi:type II secretory pathway pseudopilin PulG
MNKKRWNDSGFTIIELLASSAIVLVAIIGLFVGIQFTENQIFKNYRTRKAILLVSARLEYNNYFRQRYIGFKANPDDIPIYSRSYRLQKLTANRGVDITFDTSIDSLSYSINQNVYKKVRISVVGEWREPTRNNKKHHVMLMEDYYATRE